MTDKKIYFSKVPNIGDLILDETFFEFEYIPILFSCIDSYNNYYLCLCSEIRKVQQWIISPISKSLLIKMLKDEITIYDAFKQSKPNKIYAEYTKDKEIFYKLLNFEEIDDNLLPDKYEYLEDEESFEDYIKQLQETETNSLYAYNNIIRPIFNKNFTINTSYNNYKQFCLIS